MNNHYIIGQIDLPLSQLKKVLLFYFLAFGMNPKIGGPSPPQVEKMSLSKLQQEHLLVCRKWTLLLAHS